MVTVNDLFLNPKLYDHPSLRYWLFKRNDESVKHSYIEFIRELEHLTFNPTIISFVVIYNNGTKYCNEEPWSDTLNNSLIEQMFKVRSVNNEISRFGYMLLNRFKPVADKFSNGVFNYVLVKYLKENMYCIDTNSIEINEQKSKNRVKSCNEYIDYILSKSIIELKDKLGYSNKECSIILLGAITYYIDERFNITNRKVHCKLNQNSGSMLPSKRKVFFFNFKPYKFT